MKEFLFGIRYFTSFNVHNCVNLTIQKNHQFSIFLNLLYVLFFHTKWSLFWDQIALLKGPQLVMNVNHCIQASCHVASYLIIHFRFITLHIKCGELFFFCSHVLIRSYLGSDDKLRTSLHKRKSHKSQVALFFRFFVLYTSSSPLMSKTRPVFWDLRKK